MIEEEGTPESTFQMRPHKLEKVKQGIQLLKSIIEPQESLLDVGCGEGYVCKAIGHPNYTGIDAVEKHLETAKALNPGLTFIHKNLWDLEGRWDIIFCSRVLQHLYRFDEAVKKLLSCANRKLIIVIPIGKKDLRIDMIEGHKCYFRVIEESRVISLGKCKIFKGSPFSVVVYDVG